MERYRVRIFRTYFCKFYRVEFWHRICGASWEFGQSGELPLKFVGFGGFALPPLKLNSIAISENLPIRHT
jgi:hypothetical protein